MRLCDSMTVAAGGDDLNEGGRVRGRGRDEAEPAAISYEERRGLPVCLGRERSTSEWSSGVDTCGVAILGVSVGSLCNIAPNVTHAPACKENVDVERAGVREKVPHFASASTPLIVRNLACLNIFRRPSLSRILTSTRCARASRLLICSS